MKPEQHDRITEKTSLPFKIVVPIITTVMIASWCANQKMNQIQQGIDQSWKSTEQQRWADKLRAHNPGIFVPNVEDIRSGTERERDRAEFPSSVGSIVRVK